MASELVQVLSERMTLLGHPTRIRILEELYDGEHNVQSLADALMTTQQNVSGHLKLLRAARVVSRRPAGRQVFYTAIDRTVFDGWVSARKSRRSSNGTLSTPRRHDRVEAVADDGPHPARRCRTSRGHASRVVLPQNARLRGEEVCECRNASGRVRPSLQPRARVPSAPSLVGDALRAVAAFRLLPSVRAASFGAPCHGLREHELR